MNFDSGYFFASLIWGTIGFGMFVYGTRQKSGLPLLGGAILMVLSYLVGSALWMSLAAASVLAGVIFLSRR